MERVAGDNPEYLTEMERLRQELEEANMTLEAIRTGQVDALLVESASGPQLYTLNSADQTYRFFIEQMKEGAITLDRNGLILFSNSQFAKLVGEPVSLVVGRKLTDFLPESDAARCRRLQELSWTLPGKAEFCILQPGKRIPVQFSMTALEPEQGSSLSVLATDLTEQKIAENVLKENNEKLLQMNQELESSNHDLQQFASVASHDLQEPVRKIQIFSAMLKENEQELSKSGIMHLDKVISSAGRMKMLIVDILNYSGLSANQSNIAEISLTEMTHSLIEDFELIIQSARAEITVDFLPVIIANPGQIRQVLQNLLSNALKFVSPGNTPKIVIGSRRLGMADFNADTDKDGGFWLISISDNGIGFEEKYAENIFSLFERLNGKDKFEGTGIGLAITKKIIEKHGGLIRAESAPGKGSVFSFIIPAKPEIKT